MPTARQLLVVCVISATCALAVALVLHLLGLGERAPLAAALSAAVSATTLMMRLQSDEREEDSTDTGP